MNAGPKIAIVSGICVEHDAISNAVVLQRNVLQDAGYDVRVFVQHNSVIPDGGVVVTDNPWGLVSDPFYERSDLVIFHYGIHYALFDALNASHPRAVRVVDFHNITPPEFVSDRQRDAVYRSLDQISIATRADVLWSDSEHNSDVLVELADVERHDIRRVELCVPTVRALHPDRTPVDRNSPVHLVSVGRIVAAKGLHDVVAAMSLDAVRHEPVELTIAGSSATSDDDYLADLRRAITAAGLDDRVRVLVDEPDERIAELYERADVLVTGSYHEGFCVPVIEALAAGCRVVATESGALADTVGSCGELVPSGDPPALAAAIGRAVAAVREDRTAPLAVVSTRHDEVARHLARFSLPAFRRRLLHEVSRLLGPSAPPTTTSGDPSMTRHDFLLRQKVLFDRLGCPECSGRLEVRDGITAHDAVVVGDLTCSEHGRVGVVDAYRPSFLDRELDRIPAGPRQDVEVRIPLGLAGATLAGHWDRVPEGLRSTDGMECSLSLDVDGSSAIVRLLGHPWGGIALVVVDDECFTEIDTHRAVPEPIELTIDLGPGPHVLHLVATGRRSGDAPGSQLVVDRVESAVAADEAPLPWSGAFNRGNPYPARFDQLLAELPADAVVLDCGGGDRRYGDSRVFNMEYLDFELPDLFGDGLHLPFQDDSFDLVLSQAVLEHVPDPQRALDEMVRILRPGGLVYLEIAFMQPLHAVPYHFFNVTPHGIAHLCRDIETIESGSFGGLEETIRWIGGLFDAESRLGPERFVDVLATLGELDRQLSPGELASAASAVFLLGRKPRLS